MKPERRTLELIGSMASAGHAHILGTECDVLYVPGSERTIRSKVDAMMRCGARATSAES